ncbi:MAG: DUF669 domain-containing protein [Elusimicrobia bacterium]|nr:DUF669 domain-containing protein [Elusimicrobiota bacterium]
MPKIDFSKVDDVQDFTPIPAGKYLCKVAEVQQSQTQFQDEMWKLRFQVVSGEHTGRQLFDNMVFSEAAMKRAKLICSRLGLDVTQELNLTPEMIKNRQCHLTVEVEEYQDEEGRTKKRNVVPFAGYERAEEEAKAPEELEEISF